MALLAQQKPVDAEEARNPLPEKKESTKTGADRVPLFGLQGDLNQGVPFKGDINKSWV